MADLDATETARLRRRMVPALAAPTKAAAYGGVPSGLVIVWFITHVLHLEIDPATAVALGSLCSSIAAYFTRHGRRPSFVLMEKPYGQGER